MLADGILHLIRLGVDGDVVRLFIDDVVYEQTLTGAVDDCTGPADGCTLHVGQRAGGYVLRTGCLYAAVLYRTQAL